MDPLDIAILIAQTAGPIRRDPTTGLYVVRTTPMTLAQYESGMRVLQLREKAALARAST